MGIFYLLPIFISQTCNIISVTIHAVTKSPVQVPSAATFIKFSFETPKKLESLYEERLEPALRKPLNKNEKRKRDTRVVRNMIIHEPWQF